MLNNKSRPGLRHLPAIRKWASHQAGQIIFLPAARIAGGWAAGWTEFHPWRIESFDCAGNGIVRSLADRRVVKSISARTLELFG